MGVIASLCRLLARGDAALREAGEDADVGFDDDRFMRTRRANGAAPIDPARLVVGAFAYIL